MRPRDWKILLKRLDHLTRRIDAGLGPEGTPGYRHEFDEAERAALGWALALAGAWARATRQWYPDLSFLPPAGRVDPMIQARHVETLGARVAYLGSRLRGVSREDLKNNFDESERKALETLLAIVGVGEPPEVESADVDGNQRAPERAVKADVDGNV